LVAHFLCAPRIRQIQYATQRVANRSLARYDDPGVMASLMHPVTMTLREMSDVERDQHSAFGRGELEL
jgi:hypothetical protein